MAYIIEKAFFEKLAIEIAELANICKEEGKPDYKPDSVEIACVLIDYKDGMGYRVVSRALLRNPKELLYDIVTDVLGPPKAALEALHKQLSEKAKNFYDFKFKLKNLKSN